MSRGVRQLPGPLLATACGALALLLGSPAVFAQSTEQLRRQLVGVDLVERIGARVPLSREFHDEDGRPVTLDAYLKARRPIALTFNYSRCSTLCSLQLAGVARMLKSMPGRVGVAFDLVTVSIDPSEPSHRAKRSKEIYAGQAGGTPDLVASWHFLVGAEESIRGLADAVGFSYRRDPESGEFLHKAAIVVLTPDGRVSSYLPGVSYDAEAFERAIARAAHGRASTDDEAGAFAGLLLNCFRFDPADHAPTAMAVMRGGGVVALLFVLVLVGARLRRSEPPRKP